MSRELLSTSLQLSNTDPPSPLQNWAVRGFCQGVKPTGSSDTYTKVHVSEFCAAQLPHGHSPICSALSCKKLVGSKSQLCFDSVWSLGLHLSGERWRFAATVWKSQSLPLKGLQIALQTEGASHPDREVHPHPLYGETEVRGGDITWTQQLGEKQQWGRNSASWHCRVIRSSSSSSVSSQ